MYFLICLSVCFEGLDSLEKKSNAMFLGQIVSFTHREITPKIFKCANCFSYDTKIDAISHMNKPRIHAYIQIFAKFSAIKLLFMYCCQEKHGNNLWHKGVISTSDMFVVRGDAATSRVFNRVV